MRKQYNRASGRNGGTGRWVSDTQARDGTSKRALRDYHVLMLAYKKMRCIQTAKRMDGERVPLDTFWQIRNMAADLRRGPMRLSDKAVDYFARIAGIEIPPISDPDDRTIFSTPRPLAPPGGRRHNFEEDDS
jgi:hypothetical protein